MKGLSRSVYLSIFIILLLGVEGGGGQGAGDHHQAEGRGDVALPRPRLQQVKEYKRLHGTTVTPTVTWF